MINGGCSSPSYDYGTSQYAQAGPSTLQTRWRRDSLGRVHYVESPVLEHFAQLSLEDNVSRSPRSLAKRPHHAHVPSYDPLPEHTTPPPGPIPRTLELEDDLPMPGGFPLDLSPSQYQDPWTVDRYEQMSSAATEPGQNGLHNEQTSFLMSFPCPANGSALSTACNPVHEQSRIVQPQPKRAVRVDLLEHLCEKQPADCHRRSLRYPDAREIGDNATPCISNTFSNILRRDRRPGLRDVPERLTQDCDSCYKPSSRSLVHHRDERFYPCGASPDSGYESDPEDTITLLPSASASASTRPKLLSQLGCSSRERELTRYQTYRSPLSANLDVLTSQQVRCTLNIIDVSLKRLQPLHPNFDDLATALTTAQSCLHRQSSLSHHEWNTRSEVAHEEYQESVRSIERLIRGIREAIDSLYSHPDCLGSTSGGDIRENLSHSGKLLIGLVSKLENIFDQQQKQYLGPRRRPRDASKEANKTIHGYLRH
ncbi:hypothetical protein LshimejAT787_0409840 [Lyophyllum shimeji]|uniref:Uncharacterized protein n=1 Tax=Lyophyllum shimeji TaxID=47721 RepID=A0A9P3PL53_LYOSH|nr:hypothetical protein LshimejAT787_0409840 [Lyophyllum shimeji]